ncbi:MAG: class II aldolase/adducin family protein, partial [Gammaproteobacteria bacterium]|nr:class II aldolase/adducin family protein [Gammaproteobacteria bacterium]
MANEPDETSLREQLAAQYRHVERIGLNQLSSGNLSVRFGERMLISASGATADSIAADNVVEVSLRGDWQGRLKPSSEWRMHAAIY